MLGTLHCINLFIAVVNLLHLVRTDVKFSKCKPLLVQKSIVKRYAGSTPRLDAIFKMILYEEQDICSSLLESCCANGMYVQGHTP